MTKEEALAYAALFQAAAEGAEFEVSYNETRWLDPKDEDCEDLTEIISRFCAGGIRVKKPLRTLYAVYEHGSSCIYTTRSTEQSALDIINDCKSIAYRGTVVKMQEVV